MYRFQLPPAVLGVYHVKPAGSETNQPYYAVDTILASYYSGVFGVLPVLRNYIVLSGSKTRYAITRITIPGCMWATPASLIGHRRLFN